MSLKYLTDSSKQVLILIALVLNTACAQKTIAPDVSFQPAQATAQPVNPIAPASTYTPAQWQTRLIEFAETISPEPDALSQEFGVTWDIKLRPNKELQASQNKYFKSKSVSWKFEKSPTDFVFATQISVSFTDEIRANAISLSLPASRERCINFDALRKYFAASPWKYVAKDSIYGHHHPMNIYYEKMTGSASTRVSMQKASGSNCLVFYAVTRYLFLTPEEMHK